jgi:hypothetical protein
MSEKMIDKMNADREAEKALKANEILPDPEFLEDNDNDEEEIFGYECLGCGHVQDHPGECDMCMGSAVDPMYF